MNAKRGLVPRPPGNDLSGSFKLASARLKRLRRERQLIEQAIVALTEVARSRQPRDRRARLN
jgi:hypothetical protein